MSTGKEKKKGQAASFNPDIQKDKSQDIPGGPVVENPPCNAGDAGLIPGQETKIPHAAEQLSPHTTTKESMGHKEGSHMPQLRPDTTE